MLDWLSGELRKLTNDGLMREPQVVRPLPDGWCEVHGRRLRNFASNDYLNLAHHPDVIFAAQKALSDSGVGAGASALVSGRSPWHERLEATIAEFEDTEAAILFPTGYAANVGTLSALIQPEDVVFFDRFNHASLVDGVRLSGARLRVYRHDRLEVLERELSKATKGIRRWIVTDGVFSMDGDIAPLPEICGLAERFGAEVVVDEAHGTGVFGESGRGVCELTKTEERVAVRIGTLSKAVGALGGFVACSASVRDWLWNSARTQVFSTALPPVVCAAAIKSFELIRNEPERRRILLERAAFLRGHLSRNSMGITGTGPIIPIGVGSPDEVLRRALKLHEAGFLVGAIRPPTVPKGTSRLRVSLTSACDEPELRSLAELIGA